MKSGFWRIAGIVTIFGVLVAAGYALNGVMTVMAYENQDHWLAVAGAVYAVLIAVARLITKWWRAGARSFEKSTPAQVKLAHEALREMVTEQWDEEIGIREFDGPALVSIRWEVTDGEGPRLLRAFWPRFGGRTDRMDRMAGKFRRLDRRRLVILGAAGTGKTTLAVLMLRELLEDGHHDDPVPVLLSMSGWDPDAEPVHRWLARRLRETYPALLARGFGPDAAGALVSGYRILPVLDGLDELPEEVRPKVLAALNGAKTAHSMILTCRTEEYLSTGLALTSATVIEPHPVKPGDAADYLARSLAPGQAGDWQAVLYAIRNRPEGPLARALSTPLALWLTRKVYVETRADPAVLRDNDRFPDAAAVTQHLLDNLIPAVVAGSPPQHDPDDPHDHEHLFRPLRVWEPDDARRWLSFLASRMSAADLREFRWWELYQLVAPRWSPIVGGVLAGLITGLMTGIACGAMLALRHVLQPWPDAVAFGLAGGVAGGITGGLTGRVLLSLLGRAGMEPAYADLRLKGRWRELTRGVAVGLAVCPAVAVIASLALWQLVHPAAGLSATLLFGLLVGVTGGLMIGLNRWMTTPLTSSQPRTPPVTFRQDLALVLARTLIFGLSIGLAIGVGMPASQLGALAAAPPAVIGAVEGAAFGLAGGVVFTFIFGLAGASASYVVSSGLLGIGRHVPLRLLAFLEDAHRIGLLRQAGPVYQFRHANLQDRLAQTYLTQGLTREPSTPG